MRNQEEKNEAALGVMPKHVAVIMDGNARWANQRRLPRMAGHRAGAETAFKVVSAALEFHIPVLTLFGLSSENFSFRPVQEVNFLMKLFRTTLESEVDKLHKNNVCLRVIGDRNCFDKNLLGLVEQAEVLTKNNTALTLVFAINYGGRWDIAQATQRIARAVEQGVLQADAITADHVASYLELADLPDPDLFIRTSGELRVSNFLIWQLAYAELYFTDVLWPDFDRETFLIALKDFQKRQRRFGLTSEQMLNA